MAIGEISAQYWYTGKGPVDAKQLVKTYDQLLDENTWLSDSGSKTAYNGLFVAVWLDKGEDGKLSGRNGLYVLFDPDCTSTLKNPDVTDESNWHKLCSLDDLTSVTEELSNIKNDIEELKKQSREVITYAEYSQLPTVGEADKLYIVIDKKCTYAYTEIDGYIPLGSSDSSIDISEINGGNAE